MQKKFLFGLILLIWFIISLGWVIVENIHHLPILVIGECINLLTICFIIDSLKEPRVNSMYYIIGIMLAIWYSYYVFVDVYAKPPFNLFYVVIDLMTLSYVLYNLCIVWLTSYFYNRIIKDVRDFLYSIVLGIRKKFSH